MSEPFAFDVFLSHSAHDKLVVRALAERLRTAGLRVWFDEWAVKPGDDLDLARERGLAVSSTLVLCLTPAAVEADWITLERSTVLFRNPANLGRRFVPLLLADCDLPDTMLWYKCVDFRQESDSACTELLAACWPKPVVEPQQLEPLAVLECRLTGHTDWVNSIAVSPDGKWAASASSDKTVKIWDLATGECRATLVGHTNQVNCVAITPDGTQLLTGSHDSTVRKWDASSGRLLHTSAIEDSFFVLALTIAPSGGKLLYVGSYFGNNVHLWDLDHAHLCWSYRDRDNTFGKSCAIGSSVAISPDGAMIASAGFTDETVRLWDLKSGAYLQMIVPAIDTDPIFVAFSPDGSRLLVGTTYDNSIYVYRLVGDRAAPR